MEKRKFGLGRYCDCFCQNCGETNKNKFYKSHSGMYSSGYLPICKNCIRELFDVYSQEYRNHKKAMQRICMAFDIYWVESVFKSCNVDDKNFIGKYLTSANLHQNKGKTFDSTIAEGMRFSSDFSINEKDEDEKPIIDEKLIQRWGPGFEANDYEILEEHYDYLKKANPRIENINQEIFINDLCYTKMQQMKAIRGNDIDAYNKLTELYRKTFNQAGLKTVIDTSEMDEFRLGVTAEAIEKYTPAEYYKGRKLFVDYDKLGEYIKRFLLRPLKNLQFGENVRDEEFYIKEDDTLETVEDDT